MLSPRLLVASVALPALVVAIDDRALAYAEARRWPDPLMAILYTWFVVQIGWLSAAAGRWLPHWGWRLLIVGWSLLLINLTLGRIAMSTYHGTHLLAQALFASEVGALTSWLVLGATPWPGRLATIAAAYIPVAFLKDCVHLHLGGPWNDAWTVIVGVQVGSIAAAVGLLRAAGYRIEIYRGDQTGTAGGPVQFSLRHLLIATTLVAVIIPVMQQLLRSSQWLSGLQWIHASSDGLLLGLVSLTALWMALGRGRWAIKAILFLVLATAAAGALWWLETSIAYKVRWSFRPEPLTDAGRWWFAWTLLTGAFLAGSLFVLRATDYRLVRRQRAVHAG